MAHSMYGIDAQLQKFPQVAIAFDRVETDLEAAFYPIGGEAAAIKAPGMIIDTVDQNLAGSDADKQALIIASMYLLARIQMEIDCDSVGSLAALYGDEIGAGIYGIVSEHAALFGADSMPTGIAQAGVVTSIVTLGLFGDTIKEAGIQLPAAEAMKVKQGMTHGQGLFLPNLNAPQLKTAYTQAVADFVAVIDGATIAPKKKPGNNGPVC